MTQFHDLEAEMRILANAMTSSDWANELFSKAKDEYFHSPKTLTIYSIMKQLHELDREISFATVREKLPLQSVSVQELAQVAVVSGSGLFIEDFLEILEECHKRRQLEKLAQDILSQTKSAKASEILKSLDSQSFAITTETSKKLSYSVDEFVSGPLSLIDIVQKRQQNFIDGKPSFEGMPTHYYDLDKLIRGFTPGHFTLIGARPAMGKTTLALNLIEQLCFKSQGRCLFFSLEMPAKEVVEKIFCQTVEIPFEKISNGSLVGKEFQRFVEAANGWKNKKLVIHDQASLSIEQIKSRSIRHQRLDGINIIFIDYVQLITSKGHESRHLEVGHISRKLKEIAKELNVPIVALAQLNRMAENRSDKRPFISDLRESGSLEADADEIILIHRPEVYESHDKPGIMELNIAKNRFGPTGQMKLLFKKEYGGLKSYAAYEPNLSGSDLSTSEQSYGSPHFY